MNRMLAGIPLTALLLTGCTAAPGLSGKTPNRMAGRFTAEVTVTTADSESRAVLTRYGTDAWCVAFTEPPALDGVQMEFMDSEVTASYKGLEFSVPQTAQALRTELSELMAVVDETAPETELDTHAKDDLLVYEGEREVGSYSLFLDENGVPVRFSLPAYGLVIAFDSFCADDSAAVTETETIPKTYPVTDEVTETVTPTAGT